MYRMLAKDPRRRPSVREVLELPATQLRVRACRRVGGFNCTDVEGYLFPGCGGGWGGGDCWGKDTMCTTPEDPGKGKWGMHRAGWVGGGFTAACDPP